MLSEKVLFAINDVDDGLLEAVSRRLGYKYNQTPVRIAKLSRRAVLLAAVITAFLALGAVAYAANLWGIREMFNNPNRELPGTAADLIEPQDESARGEGFCYRVTESLCDATQILMTVTVTGGDAYILAPTDAMPDSPLWVIGRDGEGTLADYAAAQGKKLLYVSANLALPGPTGPEVLTGGNTFKNLSDREMTILIQAERPSTAALEGTVCYVTALEDDSMEPKRLELPVDLTETASESVGVFVPGDPNAVPGIHVGEAIVTKTPLGISAVWPEDMMDEEAYRHIMKIDFEELTDYREGGTVLGDDGVWRHQVSMGQGIVTDTLTVHFYDWDKQPIGDIVFIKK